MDEQEEAVQLRRRAIVSAAMFAAGVAVLSVQGEPAVDGALARSRAVASTVPRVAARPVPPARRTDARIVRAAARRP